MNKNKLLVAGALVLLIGTGATLLLTGRGEASADAPASTGPTARATTTPPKVDTSRRVVGPPEYQAIAADAINAGAAAFRAYTDDYVDAVKAELQAQMAKEHLSEGEVRELTYFGMLAKTSLDWNAVEAMTGHPIHPNARRYAEDAMFDASSKMTKELRAEVAAGGDEAARKATIDRIERDYLDQYFHLTGMDADLLDWMLWQYVHDHPGEPPVEDIAGSAPQPSRSGGKVNRHLEALPPPPPPPEDSPPPGAATPASTN